MPPILGESIGDLSDDDYVARLLAREARDSSLKYSSQGLEAYMPKRPTSGAPKPNTRFLRNIIRETDNHNAALKRKEEREARERMRQLREHASSSFSHISGRRRELSGNQDPKQRREEERKGRHAHSHRRRHRSRSGSTERGSSRRHRRRHEADDRESGRYSRASRSGRHRDKGDSRRRSRGCSPSRSRSGSPQGERIHRSHSRHRQSRHTSYRSPSPRRPRSPRSRSPNSPQSHEYRDNRQSPEGSRKHERNSATLPLSTTLRDNRSEEESDPLEDLIGPPPPKSHGLDEQALRPRGRGAYKTNISNIDAHFAPDYDPTLDVQLEKEDDSNIERKPTCRPVPGLMDEDDDWELALEALRDRARWRQKGEQRLREAGFNESVLERWKSDSAFTGLGDMERKPEDVKWSKRGEGREWDRGKVIGGDGQIHVKAPW
ncbi:hypothetical protein MAP00_008295 [Monascus purpureus]|nr:hypothetical protein MAP00_008295 [Monascus purpureus]